jgi:hypothetical protein
MTYRLHGLIPMLAVFAFFLVLSVSARAVQEPPPPPAPAAPARDESSTAKNPKKYSHANDFLIRGSVFNDKALSFPGVQLRIKRSGEKKFHWETVTNSRGDFALRVPQGAKYEIVVHVKGFADQTRAIDAQGAGGEQSYTFRLQPLGGKP